MTEFSTLRKTLALVWLVLAGVGVCHAVDAKSRVLTESERLNAFFEAAYQQQLARDPVLQSYLGIRTDYDKWTDISDRKGIEDIEIAKHYLAKMKANFDYNKLDDQAKLSYRLFEDNVQRKVESLKWIYHDYPVNQMSGLQSTIPSFLINIHQVSSVEDARAYIARLSKVNSLLEQLIEKLKTRKRKLVMPPKFVYAYAIQNVENILKGKPFDESSSDSPLLEDFRKKVEALEISKEKKVKLIVKAERALLTSVKPGYEALKALLVAYEKVATQDDGVWKLPNGADYYVYQLKQATTTNLSPEEIHQYGLQEVERIHREMRVIMQKTGFIGTLQEFFEFMRTAPQFYYSDTDEGRQKYLALSVSIIDTMKKALPKAFKSLPKADVIVKAVEPFREKSAGWAFYEQPSLDGKRPGTFYVNLYRMEGSPTYTAEALAYHEGVPGHHMQIAIAQELEDVPKFRKFGENYTAYIEGWGLYSEYLAKEMGFYQDPYSDFGRLSMELWRAIRLVVDTGLHYKKWTREQTIEYQVKNSANSRNQAINSAERYIVIPGQATAYKIGMRSILELREQVRAKLGDRFDFGEYHDVILRNGSMPLPLMQEIVEQWVAGKQK